MCLSGESSTEDSKTADCAYAPYRFHIDKIDAVDYISDGILNLNCMSLPSNYSRVVLLLQLSLTGQ